MKKLSLHFSEPLQDSSSLSKTLRASPRLFELLQDSPSFSKILRASPRFSELLQDSPSFSKTLRAFPRFSELLQVSPSFSPSSQHHFFNPNFVQTPIPHTQLRNFVKFQCDLNYFTDFQIITCHKFTIK